MILQFLRTRKKNQVALELDQTKTKPKRKRANGGVEVGYDPKRARLVKNNLPPVVLLSSRKKKIEKSEVITSHVDLIAKYKTEYANDPVLFDQIVGYLKSPSNVVKPLMIRGPTGCGKSTAVYKAAAMFKTRVHEVDLDEYKTIQAFLDTKVIRNTVISNHDIDHRKYIVLVRGLEGYTKDFLLKKLKPALEKAYASYTANGRKTHVLIFTATHQYDRNLKPLEGVCGMVKWMRPLKETMVARLFDRVMRENPSYRHMLMKRTRIILDARGDARSMFNTMMMNEAEGVVYAKQENQRDSDGPAGFFDYVQVFFERPPQAKTEYYNTLVAFMQNGVFTNAPLYASSMDGMVTFLDHWSESVCLRTENKEVDMVEYAGLRSQLIGEYARVSMRGKFRRKAHGKIMMPPRQIDSHSYGASMSRCQEAQACTLGYLPSSMEIHERLMLSESIHPIHPQEYQDKARIEHMNKKSKLEVSASIAKQLREQSKGDRIVLTSSYKSVVPEDFKASSKVLVGSAHDDTGISASSFILG